MPHEVQKLQPYGANRPSKASMLLAVVFDVVRPRRSEAAEIPQAVKQKQARLNERDFVIGSVLS